MEKASLETRFLDAIGGRGRDLDEVRFAADFSLLVVRTLGLVNPSVLVRKTIEAAVSRQFGWEDDDAQALVVLALSPGFRDGLREEEMWAFSQRFGEVAAAVVRSKDKTTGMADFAKRHGPAASLALLDALFAVATADTHVNLREVRRLEEAAEDLDVDPVLVAALLLKHDDRMALGEMRFALTGERMTIGRRIGSDILLSDPQVAPRHAVLESSADGWRVSDGGSGRPTVLNGRPVSASPLADGDRLQVGPYTLVFDGEALVASSARQFSSLSIRSLKHQIDGVSLIDDVSFTVFSGEVIAVVGPSGSGKTTLLNAINGIAPADAGEVLLDGQCFHGLVARDSSLVGIVPQDDLVHAELSVEESLFYSGRLRLPSSVTDAQVWEQVDRVLAELGLQPHRHSRIGDVARRGISGGQRKRVNLGQELMSQSTRVLFLDEPTSGLDPRASQDIASRVRQLADRGRIVFLVTHDLTPEIMNAVDHMLVIAPGGRLAFFGPPAKACRWFDVATPDGVFNRFGDRAPAVWASDYRKSADARTYVETREQLLALEGVTRSGDSIQDNPRSLLAQTRAQLARYAKVKVRDRTGMAVLLAQPPFWPR
jgi:ABC-type multidrug transport system ATPase subunit